MSVQINKTTLDAWIEKKHGLSLKTREAVEMYQLRRIAETVKHAKENSPFYASLYENYAVPANINDFERLPFTDANDLRNNALKMLTVPQREIKRIVTLSTTGTTGEPKRVYFTEADHELTVDYFANGMRVLVKKGDTVGVYLPHKTPGSVGDLLAQGLERIGATPLRHGLVTEFAAAAEALSLCDSLVGIPVQVLALAEYCAENNIKTHIRTLLLSTDNVPNAIKRRLNTLLGAEVFEHYGMTETGYGCALDCTAHIGMHVRENDMYAEIIKNDKTQAKDGEWGELVLTTLTREGMPFIRYRTGDRARIWRGTCTCKSVLSRIEIKGRLADEETCESDEMFFEIDGVVDYKSVNGDVVLYTMGTDIAGYKCEKTAEALPVYEGKRKPIR